MRTIKTAVGISAIALLSIAAATSADTNGWSAGQSASTGNLYHPSMVEDSNGHQHVVARGDTGTWYITDKSGSFVRTRMTRDKTTVTCGSCYVHRSASSPLVAINGAGTLTVVYALNLSTDVDTGCDLMGLRYRTRSGSKWSKQTIIPDTTCETATGLVVHGSKIYLATYYENRANGEERVTYTTNASGSWTHVVVASGLEPH